MHAHARQRRIGKSCGLQVAFSEDTSQANKSATPAFCNCNFATFVKRRFYVYEQASSHLHPNGFAFTGKPLQGSPKCLTMASTSRGRNVRRFGL